ncbi:hypothetical protein E9993_04675 [Labilibacter sediminis]|nr:hypothetical protein E9993_04675 [Labilibacter sediminis]
MKTLFITTFVLVFITSCTCVHFSEPQPKGSPVLNAFPKDYIGVYVSSSEKEKDTVYIHERFYEIPETYSEKIHIEKLNKHKNIKLKNNLLYNTSIPVDIGIPYSIKNDTLSYKINLLIPYYLSDSLQLKKLGKYFVLNQKDLYKEYWSVYLLSKQKDESIKLEMVGNFDTNTDDKNKTRYDGNINDFFHITDFKEIENENYLINPSKRELKKLIRKDFFKELDVLLKVKP